MIPAESRPSQLFAKMFLQGKPAEIRRQKQKLSDGRSILDSIVDQRRSLLGNASPVDRARLEEYFESVRQAEKNLVEAQAWFDRPKPKVDANIPTDITDKTDLVGRIELLFNLVPLIVQTDSSRVISIVIQSNHGIPQINGVSSEHHNLSHHGRDPVKIDQLMKIERAIVTSFGGLLTQLKNKQEAGGTLLDNTMTLFGSNLGSAAAHDPRNNPIIMAGGGYKHAADCNLAVHVRNRRWHVDGAADGHRHGGRTCERCRSWLSRKRRQPRIGCCLRHRDRWQLGQYHLPKQH